MKVVIFAGGLGTRLTEETAVRPKPMIEIGGKPILWHIMKIYASHGLTNFVVLGGYKVEVIKQYFANYRINNSDLTVDLETGEIKFDGNRIAEPWKVTILDTGVNTMTWGRLKLARKVIGNERFCATYGDGVADVDIGALLAFHDRTGMPMTLTAVTPPGRFGVIDLSDDKRKVTAFREKDSRDSNFVNSGFFVCEPEIFDLIRDDNKEWDQEPMQDLVKMGKLAAYVHNGYWQSMDTLRDKAVLEAACAAGAPWLRRGAEPAPERVEKEPALKIVGRALEARKRQPDPVGEF